MHVYVRNGCTRVHTGSATAIERRAITYDELRMRRRQQQKEQAAKED